MTLGPASSKERWRDERRRRDRNARWAERFAALALMFRGYRILAIRQKTPAGEIDLIAVRGRRLSFVEVKQRASQEAAEAAITGTQRDRVRRAANLWLARHPRYQTHEMGFDVMFVIGRRWPLHIENGL